jgi:hypothetical protein
MAANVITDSRACPLGIGSILPDHASHCPECLLLYFFHSFPRAKPGLSEVRQ